MPFGSMAVHFERKSTVTMLAIATASLVMMAVVVTVTVVVVKPSFCWAV